VAVEADAVVGLDAEALVHGDTELREHLDELDVGTDARAARGEVVSDPHVDVDSPHEVGEQVGGKQAANGADDDHSGWSHYR